MILTGMLTPSSRQHHDTHWYVDTINQAGSLGILVTALAGLGSGHEGIKGPVFGTWFNAVCLHRARLQATLCEGEGRGGEGEGAMREASDSDGGREKMT